MSDAPEENNGRASDGKFAPGNPGKAKGTRWRQSRAAEQLLEGECEELTRKAIELAKAGDTTALRLCLERLVPVRKDRTIEFDLPAVVGLRITRPRLLPSLPVSRPVT